MKKLLIVIILVSSSTFAQSSYVKSCISYIGKTEKQYTLLEAKIDFCNCVEAKLLARFGSTQHISTRSINKQCRFKALGY